MDLSVIDRLAHANVLVVGDVLLDRFIDGKVSRVSPEAPVPVLKNGSSRALLGGAGNVAANLLSYGATVTLVGAVGADAAAAEMRALCAGFHRLTADLVEDPARPTTVKARYLSGWHQLLRVDDEDQRPLPATVADRLVEKAVAALARAKVLVLSDYAKGVLEPATVAVLINAARRAGVAVVVDPKKADAAVFAGATLITPNAEEMARFAGLRIDSTEAAEAACRNVLEKVAVDAILVTRGEAGMTLVPHVGTALHVAAESHRVYDVTGAGDTVVATLAAALSVGVPLADAVRLANTAAGIVVTKPGTAVAHPNELRRALGAATATGVAADRAEAAEQVALWREQGLKVGFTNGCFDLLHRGHLHSLDQAARRVDRLVVGVNGDASVTRLKGPRRPVQDLATRSAVLAALRFVDLVVPFDEDTPEALIAALKPDVLFKGADYAGKEVVGAAFVEAHGGRVELLPLLDGHSTSDTLARARGEAAE
jgi:D-beta-D-heptose 7-phosphate kinase/D-beta-D-heptose 1-phosphate adenosyltransferase